ncbi:MAG: hypothetical protein WDN26_14690 [Chitinophagaceae bacterium]
MSIFIQRSKQFLLIAILFLFQNELKAQSDSYVEGMPAPEEVLNKIDDLNPVDAAAKKVAALQDHLPLILETIATNGLMNEKERNLMNAYKQAAGDFKNKYESDPALTKKDKRDFNLLCSKYANSGNLQDDILRGLVSADVRKRFNDTVNESIEKAKPQGKGNKPVLIMILGVALIVVAYIMKHKLNRYEFNHRNSSGAIEFATYEDSMWHRRKHGIAKVLYSLGLIVLVIGIIMYFA